MHRAKAAQAPLTSGRRTALLPSTGPFPSHHPICSLTHVARNAMTVYECKWGILATGGIAKTFAKDLLLEPATRGVSDVKHTIAAVASSTSAERAQKFLEDVSHPSPASVATYGDYEQLVADPHVDVIYVATPHTMHYANSLLALNAGKSVLCEVRSESDASWVHND